MVRIMTQIQGPYRPTDRPEPQYIIVFDKPVRLGIYVTECVGPFLWIADALTWLQGEFAVDLPSHQVLSILPPDGQEE
jgi:hypothetical protein